MTRLSRLAAVWAALSLTACATTLGPPQPYPRPAENWTPVEAQLKAVGLGLPGGAVLAPGLIFAGGVEIVAAPTSPLHSLSDLKLTRGDGLVAVSDVGDLVQADLRLDRRGRLVGLDHIRARCLTLPDGAPIVDKADGDAEGLILTPQGDLLISFERRHRLWNYGPLSALTAPRPLRIPDFPFAENDGMEGIAVAPDGWRVAGEAGGVWDCSPARCVVVTAPPSTPVPDSEYRITGMDRDPSGDGWFVVERRFRLPFDARGRIRRMAPDGTLGPVLIELKLPGTTDNFEGIAAQARAGGVRLYILSDDNFNPVQRTLLLAFDVSQAAPAR
ncbi:esterase-like activity of phytase family protein [Brevundimonas sp.]|uniref:esterase-like activity of phytase family protein n=1 Tax=Brevundimonas sp. TaxID=1871086 RepID=UPI000DB1C0C6|nr:esterase-like activity of phytase family protein [Brevundimonas sp.]PZU72727.1 MAG: Tat pathway signal protein [Brevundimonas sp.]